MKAKQLSEKEGGHELSITETGGQNQEADSEQGSLDALGFFFQNINRLKTPLLSAEEEKELAYRIKKGDRSAEKEMCLANLGLVVKIAQKFSPGNHQFSLLDLFQEGFIGLGKAVFKFEPEKGYRFSTYASWWITEEIERAIKTRGTTIHIPINLHQNLSQIRSFQTFSLNAYGKNPTPEECAQNFQASLNQVENLFQALVLSHVDSLDDLKQSGNGESSYSIGCLIFGRETPDSAEITEASLLRTELEKAISELKLMLKEEDLIQLILQKVFQ